MLDSLGSALSRRSLSTFFTGFGIEEIMNITAGEYKLRVVCGFLIVVWDDKLMRWHWVFIIFKVLEKGPTLV